MTAVTADLNTPRRDGARISIPVAAATALYFGTLLCRDASGNAVSASLTSGLSFAGVANEAQDNSAGAAGDKDVLAWDRGNFRFALEGGSAAVGDIGKKVYVFDNATVATADELAAANPFLYVGRIVAIDDDTSYVWVDIEPLADAGPEASGKQLFQVQLAGVNATAFDLSTVAAEYGGSDFLVDTVISVESFVTATAAHDDLKVVTTDWTLAAGVLSTVGNETANTWKISFLGRLI